MQAFAHFRSVWYSDRNNKNDLSKLGYHMKLNKWLVLLVVACTLIPVSLYPIPAFSMIIGAIIRMERFEKPGCATIDLMHDMHTNDPVQEEAIIDALAQQKGQVCVEDMTEHVGSKHIQDSVDPELYKRAQPGCIAGL